jgi:hypothetical protein
VLGCLAKRLAHLLVPVTKAGLGEFGVVRSYRSINGLGVKPGEERTNVARRIAGGGAVPVDDARDTVMQDHLICAEVAMDEG